jgi:hypothetical protein
VGRREDEVRLVDVLYSFLFVRSLKREEEEEEEEEEEGEVGRGGRVMMSRH